MYKAWNLILAVESASEESGGIDLLLPAPEELIAGIIAFALIFIVVWKFALPTIKETLEARQAAIKGELNAAEQAKVEATSLLDDYKAQGCWRQERGGTDRC